jgi:hypothetical protein
MCSLQPYSPGCLGCHHLNYYQYDLPFSFPCYVCPLSYFRLLFVVIGLISLLYWVKRAIYDMSVYDLIYQLFSLLCGSPILLCFSSLSQISKFGWTSTHEKNWNCHMLIIASTTRITSAATTTC